eukprot:TRINITY_DN8085_c0_g1_i4.p1 TRINITY_DN8085_c0_g1~~TRINITY_DN8085_c0_g1_i4.p1  ORF type:complete len:141 (+),score=7.81 TRINITY_DN8085_c0_g1_i4:129-551(+)
MLIRLDLALKCAWSSSRPLFEQIHEDFEEENLAKIMKPEVDGDLPGLGQFYCIHCARHFIDAHALREHLKSKVHKRRVKQLKDSPYSQAEADAAAGLGTYKPPEKRTVPSLAVGVDLQAQEAATGVSDVAMVEPMTIKAI